MGDDKRRRDQDAYWSERQVQESGAKSASGTQYKYLYTHLIGSAREDRPTGC